MSLQRMFQWIGSISVLLALLLVSPSSAEIVVFEGTIGTFGSGDDLDLSPTEPIVYAINVNGIALDVNGVEFVNGISDFPGYAISSTHEIQAPAGWADKPEFGDTDDDNNLETIMHSIRWSLAPSALTVDLEVTAGKSYQLQLLTSENQAGVDGTRQRSWDIQIEDIFVVDEYNSSGTDPVSNNTSLGGVYTYNYTALDDELNILFGNVGGETNDAPDRNPILQAVILREFDVVPFDIAGNGETYFQDFDALETKTSRMPEGWTGVLKDGITGRIAGLGLTDGFLTVPGSENDGVLGVLNLGGNPESFGPATAGHIATWTAELADAFPNNPLFGQDDAVADNAADRALGISRENSAGAGELNFEVEIVDAAMRAFVLDWDLEIWGGDPDADFRSAEGPGMKVDVMVGWSVGTPTAQ